MSKLTTESIRDIMRAARSTKTASAGVSLSNPETSMADTNGEVKANSSVQSQVKGLQDATNPPSGGTLVATTATEVSNQVGHAGPDGGIDDSTNKAISDTNSLKAKIANILSPNKVAAAAAAVTPVATQTPVAQQAQDNQPYSNVKVSYEDIEKIATVLSTERGRKFVERELLEQVGAAHAENAIKTACEFVMQHDQNLIESAQQFKIATETEAAFAQLTPLEQHRTIKTAAAFDQLVNAAGNDQIKIAALQGGYADALAYIESCPTLKVAADGEELPPGAEAPVDEMGGEMPPEEAPAEGSEGQLEEVLMALQHLVESGQLSEEEAMQIVQTISADVQGLPEGGVVPEQAAVDETATKAASIVDALFAPAAV